MIEETKAWKEEEEKRKIMEAEKKKEEEAEKKKEEERKKAREERRKLGLKAEDSPSRNPSVEDVRAAAGKIYSYVPELIPSGEWFSNSFKFKKSNFICQLIVTYSSCVFCFPLQLSRYINFPFWPTWFVLLYYPIQKQQHNKVSA